jgi:hypothetical protein
VWKKQSFEENIPFDESLYYSDFEKINHTKILYIAWKALEIFKSQNKGQMP